MTATSIELFEEIDSSSDIEENEISFSSVSSVSSARCTSSSPSLYTTKNLEFLLRTEKQKYCILTNETKKKNPRKMKIIAILQVLSLSYQVTNFLSNCHLKCTLRFLFALPCPVGQGRAGQG